MGRGSKKELKLLFTNTVMLYIMQVSAYIFPLITFPWLTRALGPEQYGIMNVANAIITYFQLFVDFGFLLSATRECALHRDNKEKLMDIVASVIQAKLILCAVGAGILLALGGTVEMFRKNIWYLLLCYISVMLSVFVPDYLFRGLEKMSSITYRSILSRSVYALLVIAFVRGPKDVILIPVFNAISNLVIVGWSWIFVVKKFKLRLRWVSFSKTMGAIKQSAVFFASRIATTVYSASNVFVLGLVFGSQSAAMGQYTAANNLVTNGRGMFSPIADSLYPYMVSKKDYKIVKIILIASIPLLLGGTAILYIFAEWFVQLLCGQEYVVGNPSAVDVFRAMTPLFILTLPVYILGFPVLGAMNMMKEANYTIMYAAAFHIVGMAALWITGNLGFVSVAYLTCLSECVVLASRIYYVRKGHKNKKREESNEKSD